MKKIGIALDTYKIEAFEKELTAQGFEFKTTRGPKRGMSAIAVQCTEAQFSDYTLKIGRLCRKVEYTFKRQN